MGRIKHQYPTCWRSNHKVVWLARREYFYMIDKLDNKPMNAVSNVNFFFESPKNRFVEIIKEQELAHIERKGMGYLSSNMELHQMWFERTFVFQK